MAQGQANGLPLPWSRENKPGGKAQLQEAKLQQELQEQRAVQGLCQVPLARGGVPTLPAASDLTQGAATTCKMCSAQGNNEAPELPWAQAVVPLLLQHLLSSQQLPCMGWGSLD